MTLLFVVEQNGDRFRLSDQTSTRINVKIINSNYGLGPSYKEIYRTWLEGRTDFIINRRAKLKPDLESAAQNL